MRVRFCRPSITGASEVAFSGFDSIHIDNEVVTVRKGNQYTLLGEVVSSVPGMMFYRVRGIVFTQLSLEAD